MLAHALLAAGPAIAILWGALRILAEETGLLPATGKGARLCETASIGALAAFLAALGSLAPG